MARFYRCRRGAQKIFLPCRTFFGSRARFTARILAMFAGELGHGLAAPSTLTLKLLPRRLRKSDNLAWDGNRESRVIGHPAANK